MNNFPDDSAYGTLSCPCCCIYTGNTDWMCISSSLLRIVKSTNVRGSSSSLPLATTPAAPFLLQKMLMAGHGQLAAAQRPCCLSLNESWCHQHWHSSWNVPISAQWERGKACLPINVTVLARPQRYPFEEKLFPWLLSPTWWQREEERVWVSSFGS